MALKLPSVDVVKLNFFDGDRLETKLGLIENLFPPAPAHPKNSLRCPSSKADIWLW